MSKCPECGGNVTPDEYFCGNCGSPLPQASDSVQSTPVEGSDVDPALSSTPSLPEVSSTPEESSAVEVVSESFLQTSLGGSPTGNVPLENLSPDSVTERRTTGGHRSAVKQLDAGTALNGRYEIVRRIGGGGMGAVYLAKDRNLGDAPRAVKEMVESHLDEAQHEKAIGDFKRESLLLTSLEHPSIPTIYDYFYDTTLNRFYLVMKYISGGDLASRMRGAPGGRVDEKTVTDWGMQVADVLEYLHTRPKPIIYRDLKPANLMIDGNTGRVMLIDFGIARWVNKQEKGVTAVGTMGYAPPELFSGRAESRSDVYSLGATMFHLLTAADPQDNPLLIFDFSKNPRPRQVVPSISTEMERILMRAVEYKPEDRFLSAGELRDVLAEHLEQLMSGRGSPCTAAFAEAASPWMTSSAPTAASASRWRRWPQARPCAPRDPPPNWWSPGPRSWTRRLSCRRTATFSAAPIRTQTSFRRLISRASIAKRRCRAVTRASGAKGTRFWLKIWAPSTVP
jgi:serine/threonine protein kinase